MNQDDEKKENQIENLMNLVEKHTRTERHLEQYSEIGNKESKEKAREKQDVREQEINNLKSKIVTDTESKEEQVQSSVDNYKKSQAYMEDNYEKLSDTDLENLQNKQENRRNQIGNLSKKIYDSKKDNE